MEFLAEILFEIYGERMFLIIPEKHRSKKYVWLSKIIAVVVFLGVIALAVANYMAKTLTYLLTAAYDHRAKYGFIGNDHSTVHGFWRRRSLVIL